MLYTETDVLYKAFGLRVLSDITLPELPQLIKEDINNIDIFIEKTDLSKVWGELSSNRKKFVIKEGLVMFEIPDVAIFSINNGNKISFTPKPYSNEDIIRIYILGTCMGALLMQRRVYPLHGSAVAIDGKAYAIIGDSGAGKSTLASIFLEMGYQLLSDDVIAVSLSPQNKTPYVTPSYPQQKLWQDSLENIGLNSDDYKSIYGRENKYCVPVNKKYFTEPLPLAGVFELIKSEESDIQIQIQNIEGLEKLRTLFYHTYRSFLIPEMDLTEWHFKTITNIANNIGVYKLIRPLSGRTTQELASLIKNSIKGERS